MGLGHDHDTPSLDDLKTQADLRDAVPIHIGCIREQVDALTNELYEHGQKFDALLEMMDRQNKLLESIDHAHYYVERQEVKFLRRIAALLVTLVVGFFTFWLFPSLL